MKPAHLAALPIIIAGITLIVIGVRASDSFADQLSNTFLGHFTDRTAWYIAGGIALLIGGGVLALLGGRPKRS